jgi:hypothetical protein
MKPLVFGCLLVSGFATPGIAQPSPKLMVDIPFSYQLGNAKLPPGEFIVSRVRSSRELIHFVQKNCPGGFWYKNCAAAFRLIRNESRPYNNQQTPRIVFNKYGQDRYFVSEIWDISDGVILNKSTEERELITTKVITATRPEKVVIVAELAR